MNSTQLVEDSEGCILTSHPAEYQIANQQFIPSSIPLDLCDVLMKYCQISIHPAREGHPPSGNTWLIGPIFWSDSNTIAKFFGPAEREDAWRQSYHENFYIIGSSQNDGSEFIGLSVDPQLYGMVFHFRVEALGPPLGIPKIANSFSEWLEKTLESGPDVSSCYWGMPDFKDMGPAIPGDPYYRPFGIQ